jgi:hypothetical protein
MQTFFGKIRRFLAFGNNIRDLFTLKTPVNIDIVYFLREPQVDALAACQLS